MGDMEKKEIITNLNNVTKTLSKIIKTSSLPADLEIEACNIRYDLLILLNKLEKSSQNTVICQ